jgi:peptide/nickel transport system substrate-binding protein
LPTISPDKLTYTIPLRKGIEFNDDTPFNAHAVVVSLERDLTLPGRNALAKVVYDGAMVPDCTPISPESTAVYDPTIRCTPYDPQDAKRLVAKAGYPNPTVHLLNSGLIGQFIQAEEAAVGINVVLVQEDGSTALSDEMSGHFDAIAATFTGSPALDKNVYEYLATSGGRNFGGYSNPSLDQILANARKATSARSLKTLWHAAFQTIISDRPIIFLGHRIDYAAVSSDVKGVEFLSDLQPRVSFAQKS